MHPINTLLILSSLNVLLVTIERFSFTTEVLLQPYNFLRLHELFQMTVLILASTLIPFFMLRHVTNNFKSLQTKKGLFLGTLFITGIYFYTTGNGVHEMSSFAFNTYCDTKKVSGNLCGGLFFNDFYTGNIMYFVGAFLMNLVLVLFERDNPDKIFGKKDLPLLVINSLVYAFAIFAYAAFDRVLVGLVYSVIMTVVLVWIFLPSRKKYLQLPVTYSLIITYVVGTAASLVVRFMR